MVDFWFGLRGSSVILNRLRCECGCSCESPLIGATSVAAAICGKTLTKFPGRPGREWLIS